MQHPPELQQLFCCVFHTYILPCPSQIKQVFYNAKHHMSKHLAMFVLVLCIICTILGAVIYKTRYLHTCCSVPTATLFPRPVTMTPLEDLSESTDTGAWSTMKTFVKTKNNTVGLNTCKSIPLIRYSIHWHLEHQWLRNLKLIQL